ncbi:hypothetical protein [Nocardioides coralli]|uniref:hypothetical protein n=1 Tax=Nocardioides coralli TaxID=2872154 RepID=UPI001CA3E908|nr:hypothetical protein [Nocardioides coralli]QZY29681.1 hypothetical protein K6T13_03030 [Nocardioides coralli]
MRRLIDLKAPRDRFARSINVERDAGTHAIDGYLPVGRAIDSVERLANAMLSEGEVALSVTGPYGTGKSSLALLLDCLYAPKADGSRQTADSILFEAAPEVLAVVTEARKRANADRSGFVRAVVTAQREPVSKTVLRALGHGLARFQPPAKHTGVVRDLSRRIEVLAEGFTTGDFAVQTREIRELVHGISEVAPLLILIDEFGKNLEAFAESPGESDLFLLQELAEWTRSSQRHPIALVTLQHMAFGDYATGASGVQRREWMKIQGRFEDVPFIDTPSQTRALIAAAFGDADEELTAPLTSWVQGHLERLKVLGLADLADDGDIIRRSWPLHPLALAVLPDLCHRYGQNERTMFSFLASREPQSVGRFLHDSRWEGAQPLPAVRLNRLYDYFIESASNMVGVSADASRWIEIDTRIRDARGLSDAALELLKSIGLLNLTSSGGVLRASAQVLRYAMGEEPGPGQGQFESALTELQERALVTYRDFADEYRVWQGSDFDVQGALEQARRRIRDVRADEALSEVLHLAPVVAARHSHQSGTLRAFERVWVDNRANLTPLTSSDRGDGLVAYVVGGEFCGDVLARETDKPVVIGQADSSRLVDAAREVLALQDLLGDDALVQDDWVVRKELSERRVAAIVDAKREFESAFGPLAPVEWIWASSQNDDRRSFTGSLAAVVSEVADACYTHAIPIRNDLINRHELSSQAAKARREVTEIMQARQQHAELGLDGFGPDRTLYRSIFAAFGIHRRVGESWAFVPPERGSEASHVWDAFVTEIRSTTGSRLNVAGLFEQLALPPFGLRAGVAPILLLAVLCAHSDEFAMYEHGTFRPRLTGDVVERLLRNPGNFELKCFGTRSRARHEFVRAMAVELGLSGDPQKASVVTVVSSMVARLNMLTQYAKKTRIVGEDAAAVRAALLSATEPDELLFALLPTAVGQEPISIRDRRPKDEYEQVAARVGAALHELQAARGVLASRIEKVLGDQLKVQGDVQASLRHRSLEVKDKILDSRLRALSVALQGEMDRDEWLDYVAMQVVGAPPSSWTDEDADRFELTMHDLGAAFLRVEALAADMRALDGNFEAMRISVNSSRGGDLVRLVQLDESRSAAVGRALESTLASLLEHGVDAREAREWILAHLLHVELESTASRIDVGGRAYGDNDSSRKENLA